SVLLLNKGHNLHYLDDPVHWSHYRGIHDKDCCQNKTIVSDCVCVSMRCSLVSECVCVCVHVRCVRTCVCVCPSSKELCSSSAHESLAQSLRSQAKMPPRNAW